MQGHAKEQEPVSFKYGPWNKVESVHGGRMVNHVSMLHAHCQDIFQQSGLLSFGRSIHAGSMKHHPFAPGACRNILGKFAVAAPPLFLIHSTASRIHCCVQRSHSEPRRCSLSLFHCSTEFILINTVWLDPQGLPQLQELHSPRVGSVIYKADIWGTCAMLSRVTQPASNPCRDYGPRAES